MATILKNIIDIELRFVSGTDEHKYILVVALILGIFILYRYHKKIEAFILMLSGGSFLFSIILKSIFREARPLTAQSYAFMEKYSFPSTHTVTYTAIFGHILYLTYKLNRLNERDKFATLVLRVVCIYFIALVGISRVYLGQHFTQDVIGGYGFGCLYLALMISIEQRLESTHKNKQHNE